jgi:hypothetical protein
MTMPPFTSYHSPDVANNCGLYSNLPRDLKANQIKIFELFKADAFQANDIFHFVKCVKSYSDGGPFNIAVDAKAVIRAQDKAAIKGTSTTVEFDIVENGQRSVLGAFTGPKGLAEALTRKTCGLRDGTPVGGLGATWEDFQVWRKGQCLGTTADVRNHYYVNHKVGVAPRTRVAKNSTWTDVATTGTSQPLDLSETLSNLDLATPERLAQTIITSLPTRAKPARQSEKHSNPQLEDTLMRELFDIMPPKYQPERYNKKHTAIHAKDYIKFLQRRVSQTHAMIRLMGVTSESFSEMVQQMDNGVGVADAMRNGLEWGDDGPLGVNFGPEEETSDDSMENAE